MQRGGVEERHGAARSAFVLSQARVGENRKTFWDAGNADLDAIGRHRVEEICQTLSGFGNEAGGLCDEFGFLVEIEVGSLIDGFGREEAVEI